MNIHELDSYNLGDAVKFHRRLNPRIWGRDEHLLPEVRERLLAIAADFQEFLGVEDLNVEDITISGSNAAYSYTKNSDIDLHLVVEMPSDPVYQELFNAKKYQYNDEHNIKIGGADVELYVQPADQAHHSQGIYSIRDNKWLQIPQRKRAQIDDACVRDKVADLDARIHAAVKSRNADAMSALWNKIKAMRKNGLEQHGEFGCENIAFKLLRNSGCIRLLKDAMMAAQDRKLSLREAPQQRFRYGFGEGMQSQPYSTSDGVAASTKQFLEDSNNEHTIVQEFIQHVVSELGIDPVPNIKLHIEPEWSTNNHSFGRYDPDTHTLNVSMPNRHILDVLRTVAHELVHCSQHQQHRNMPDDAGETGSPWENDANARAGIIMRDWANTHPEHFEHEPLEENASGYIPKNKREAKMPQYAMALSVDIKPGEVGRQANKLALKTGRNGEPGLLQPDAQNLLREFSEFVTEQDNLFEITMSPSSLKKLSAQTGALAGMEFEMIVPNVEGNDDGDQEPDYDYDERCRSIEDAVQFFYDGDWNGRRDIERMRERMQNDFSEWLDDKIYQDWERNGEEFLEEWVPNNVDESEWNPEGLEGEERQEALEEYIANMHANPGSSDAFDEYREENQESYDESDWLDDEDLDRMSSIENAYSMTWPHWTTVGQGEGSIEEVADSFSEAIGRPVQASSSYHSSRVVRPSVKNPHYIVEPDSSLDPDDSDDQGLEFVSPPLPIEELLSDLNKVKAWADKTGCYTNDSTGLHINVSVPGWTGGTDQLDYVKLALLLGDEHVLDSFGRAGNTYAKSAMGKIRSIVKQNPNSAQELMDRMKSGMDQLASRVIHSRSTEKYTSINVKNGYIEFRSPGGDWLNDNFKEIDNTLRRFTVALSAAVDPEMYRQEYLKKLYKLLDVSSEKDPLSYFAKFAAGELPKAALKSFVRQAQLERGVKRGKETGPMWWRVYKEGKGAANGAIIEVVANTEEAAKRKAAQEWGEPLLVNVLAKMHAEPLRPYDGVDTSREYELYDRRSGAVVATFRASDDDAALAKLDQFRAGQVRTQGITVPEAEAMYGVRSSRAVTVPPRDRPSTEPIPGSTLDLQRQRAAATDQYYNVSYHTAGGQTNNVQVRARNADAAMAQVRSDLESSGQRVIRIEADPTTNQGPSNAAQIPTIDIDVEPAPAPQLPGMGQWNGQWKVLVGGQEVYRFGGVGNSQADANRIAAAWLRQNGQGVSGEGFEVYPVMDESLRESVNDYLWHGSRHKNTTLVPRQANDTGGAAGSNKNAIYATPNAKVAIAMGLTTPGSETGMFPNDPQMVLFKGGIRKGEMVYLHKVPKNLFINHNGREWYSKPDVKEIKIPNENIVEVPVDKYLNLIRQATPADLELQKKYTQKSNIKEYKMPQPSHGAGKIRDLNEPLGPETPPKMPAGTIKVDVSDMYDWYKLGQKISDLGSIKPNELGSGPPSTVFAFGSEDLENQYSHQLTRLGLKTHDLDEPGEEDIDEGVEQNNKKLDRVLAKCCEMIERGQQKDPERYGKVAACVIDPDNRHVYGINLPGANGQRRHAERVAINKYCKQHGDIPPGSIVVTTLSPCNSPMDDRAGESCKDLLNSVGIKQVYCGYMDPTQHNDADAGFTLSVTQNDDLWESCKAFADTFLHEQEIEEGWRSALAGAAAAGAMAFTPAPANSTAVPAAGPAVQPAAAVQQTPGAAAESALTKAAQAAGIKGVELAQFLAQCAHETGDFAHLEELGGSKYLAKYDPTVNPEKARALGNTQAGDGAKYKGRGFIQITGKANYANAGQALGIDLVNNPEAAARPDVAAKIAVWYWQNRVKPYVQDFSDTRGVTKRINPGLQGLQDRQSNFKDYQQQVAAVAQPKVTQPGTAA